MFLFLYKHNPMCSIYTRDLPYSFFYFNMVSEHPIRVQFLLVNPLFTGIFQSSPHRLAGAATLPKPSSDLHQRRRWNLVGDVTEISPKPLSLLLPPIVSDWICPYLLWLLPFPLPLPLWTIL